MYMYTAIRDNPTMFNIHLSKIEPDYSKLKSQKNKFIWKVTLEIEYLWATVASYDLSSELLIHICLTYESANDM